MGFTQTGITQATLSSFILIVLLVAYLYRFTAFARSVGIVAVVCLIDQVSKAAVERYLWQGSWKNLDIYNRPILGEWLHLTYQQNRDLGFGYSSVGLLVGTIALAIALVILMRIIVRRQYRMPLPAQLGLALLVGGLMGILLDRVRLGYVVDFLAIGGSDYRSYNPADLSALAGLALIAAGILIPPIRHLFRAMKKNSDYTSAPPTPISKRRGLLKSGGILVVAAILLVITWNVIGNYEPDLPPLHRAAVHGDTGTMHHLLTEGANVNEPDSQGLTALDYATMHQQSAAVEMLLAAGANVARPVGKNAITPLQRAVAQDGKPGDPVIVKLLLDYGAEPSPAALWLAVKSGNLQAARLLLDSGASIDTTIDGMPLIFAARDAEVIRLLLATGADINARNREGQTALHLAVREGDIEWIKLLVEAGADVNLRDQEGVTPLTAIGGLAPSIARKNEPPVKQSPQFAIVKALAEKGADVNAATNDGRTPLIHVAIKGDSDSVRLLLSAGARVNAKGPNGWTALHYAAAKGHVQVAQELLRAGADPNAKTEDGAVALDLAGNKEIADLLRKYGA